MIRIRTSLLSALRMAALRGVRRTDPIIVPTRRTRTSTSYRASSTLPAQLSNAVSFVPGLRASARTFIALLGVFVVIGGCDSSGGGALLHTNLRIYSSPYSDVDWVNDFRLKSQLHDHLGVSPTRIRAYDAAGYDAVGLMDYSGNTTLSYALTTRLWPPESVLPASLLSSLSNIKVFIPNAEEVGDVRQHATSPFLTTYIEGWTPASGAAKQSWQYASMEEMFQLVRQGGGLPCLAHPWEPQSYEQYSGAFCVEIYSAFAAARRREGVASFVSVDRNQILLDNWDYALARNQKILGIAVNDHYGPFAPDTVPDDIRDSGKTIVFAKAVTLDAYEDAMRRGAFFAVRDFGVPKDQYPAIQYVFEDMASITLQSMGVVRWVTGGGVVAENSTLRFKDLPPNSRYVRAEVEGTNGTVLYSQAFVVRPVGDIDADYDVDDDDAQICRSLLTDPTLVAACRAASQPN
jgi:hypothetical protein